MSPANHPPTTTSPSNPEPTAAIPTTLPTPHKHAFPVPLLRLELRDLSHEGASSFLSTVHGHEDLSAQVQNVLNLLYHKPDLVQHPRPGTRSVTFIVREFEGVAYTTGLDLDNDHKEININVNYIVAANKRTSGGIRHELLGVICHELVHCFQWTAEGTCPGGLVEGIADWVRLRAGLGAKHWKQEAGGSWDGGYQHTGYFLDWLEGKFGEGTVRGVNAEMSAGKYDEDRIFGKMCKGGKVGELWEEYREDLRKKRIGEGVGTEEANPIPTHAVQKE